MKDFQRMREFTVKVATAQDEVVVSSLLEASYTDLLRSHYAAELLAAALPLMTKANPRLLASGTYYIANTASGLTIGCGGWTQEQPGTGETANGLAHIRHFATHPSWIKKGVGKALISRCISDMDGSGIRAIECYSTLNAENFYGAAGFEIVRPIEVPLTTKVGFPATLMIRKFPIAQAGCC
jgi:N-acetylglutamate synthase-like GNAT family acetyltransferase